MNVKAADALNLLKSVMEGPQAQLITKAGTEKGKKELQDVHDGTCIAAKALVTGYTDPTHQLTASVALLKEGFEQHFLINGIELEYAESLTATVMDSVPKMLGRLCASGRVKQMYDKLNKKEETKDVGQTL